MYSVNNFRLPDIKLTALLRRRKPWRSRNVGQPERALYWISLLGCAETPLSASLLGTSDTRLGFRRDEVKFYLVKIVAKDGLKRAYLMDPHDTHAAHELDGVLRDMAPA